MAMLLILLCKPETDENLEMIFNISINHISQVCQILSAVIKNVLAINSVGVKNNIYSIVQHIGLSDIQ